ncbi:MAG: YidC/Oxa1 family membrane protein insertase [Candidatus Campbellbacteria bacterium]|nr:YidC/Oxa1 family membrane protein insertase [Candidatus Campbellbacteria bacterium]
MLGDFFHAVLYQPFYNALVLLIEVVPAADVGIAVIILTLAVKFIILPLSIKATRAQIKLKTLEPKIKEIQEKYKDNREEQAKAMMGVYSEAKVNPFSGIFLLLVQMPIIIALYFVFTRGGLPEIDPEVLYSFVPTPDTVNMHFLGTFDLSEKSVVLALIAAGTQFLQSHFLLSTKKNEAEKNTDDTKEGQSEEKEEKPKEPSFKDELAKSMNLQMRFVFPIIIGFIAYSLSGVIAIYFIVSGVVSIAQELFVKRRLREES